MLVAFFFGGIFSFAMVEHDGGIVNEVFEEDDGSIANEVFDEDAPDSSSDEEQDAAQLEHLYGQCETVSSSSSSSCSSSSSTPSVAE